MGNVNCSCAFGGKNEKYKGKQKSSETAENKKDFKSLLVKIKPPIKYSTADGMESISFDVPRSFGIERGPRYSAKIMNLESPVAGEIEQAYDGEDEHDDTVSMKRENSDLDLQAHVGNSNEECVQPFDNGMNAYGSFHAGISDTYEKRAERDADEGMHTRCGHISDPGFGKAEFLASPMLKRSCSDLMIPDVIQAADQLPHLKPRSLLETQRLTESLNAEMLLEHPGSPLSSRTHCSADKVMLKKHSSSQVLPSRSRKLWWKLFLWSHRNLQKAGVRKVQQKPSLNQQDGYSLDTIEASKSMEFKELNSLGHFSRVKQGGYSSDTIEARKGMDLSNLSSPGSFKGKSLKIGGHSNHNHSWDGFQGTSGFWPQNQWVAFPAESSTFSTIDQWIQELPLDPPLHPDEEYNEDRIAFPHFAEAGKSPARSSLHVNIPEELFHANSVIQSLNSSSTVAHIAGTGLKVVPSISCFSSLRSVNLSGNSIVHVSPGSLPKGLHVLNLSRNKIHTIEGLKELTRLRVLDLSYNRISRIGQGVSSCTIIKELYLVGNKISEVEGLHRLLKLTILDLSFNKITTTKALGQLVANYNSLLALNLVGNPIQNNIGDDQLRKTVCSLLPKLAFLNKQPTNPQKAREIGRDTTLKAAMGTNSRSTRKNVRRLSQGGLSSASVQGRRTHVAQKSRHSSRNHKPHHSSLKNSSALPSSH